MKALLPLSIALVLVVCLLGEANAWRGNYEVVRVRQQRSLTVFNWYCNCWYYWWGCSWYRRIWRTYYISRYQCKTGWTHNGDQDCDIPICRPSCQNNGVCTNPNVCNCPDTSSGAYCGDLTCSYLRPCYPGDCGSEGLANQCQCHTGFMFNTSDTGCTEFDPDVEEMKPIVGRSNVTLANVRRIDNYTDYMFILEGSDTDEGETEVIWSNQKRFNHMRFDVESYMEKVGSLPERPLYVHDSKLGIVETVIEANVSKVPRNGGPDRDFGSFARYPCDRITQDDPEVDMAECTIVDDQFKTLIEHGDWLHVAVKTKSGGIQKLTNTDLSVPYKNQYYQGLQVIKSFNFDFIAPKHCTETGAWDTCPSDAVVLKVAEEFTKAPIRPRWLGWTDDLSGVFEFYVEIFLLGPDQYGRLIETTPLQPEFARVVTNNNTIEYPTYRPTKPGMYSVMMETRDTANNSRISRRLVLYDDTSSISLNDEKDGKLFISSAVPETGYMWQTAPAPVTCSYLRPCYPGDCGSEGLANQCQCHTGFMFNTSDTGCTEFDPDVEEMKPIVGRSNVTLANVRRIDNYTDYMFILEGSDTDEGETEVIWSNQKRFNHMRFDVESYMEKVGSLPERPLYVHDSKLGIVETVIEANVSKVPRNGGPDRDFGSFARYPCDRITQDDPEVDMAECTIVDDQFKTLIEHGDWLHVAVKTKSGGIQKLTNTDLSVPYKNQYYQGLQVIKSFNFDFIAPKHCTETGAWDTCPSDAVVLKVAEEFTKAPIRPRWLGWTDDLSGVFEFYVEIFLLGPDQYGRLIETTPLQPEFARVVTNNNTIEYPTYRPTKPGMYSVMMETRDTANNSRISRRLVLYDDTSSISLNDEKDGKLFISSAVPETGYMWQTAPAPDTKIRIDVRWSNHFINHIHEDNKLLNEVLDYPIQFNDIADDGILSVQKYVALDDNEGERTRAEIPNYHGIVKFEMNKGYTLDDSEPVDDWSDITPFKEETSFEETLEDGARIRVWLRATDVMGQTRTDSTLMRVDGTGPVVSQEGQTGHQFVGNIDEGRYNYTSSLRFIAKDDQSGVHKFGIKLTVKTPNKQDKVLYEGFEPAMMFDTFENAACDDIEGKCFIANQDVQINNCWFLVSRDDLVTSNGSIQVTSYNQAMLTTTTTFDIGNIVDLKGLEEYDGPYDYRIESLSDRGFRVTWKLPKEESCYGRATVVLTIIKGKDSDGNLITETFYVSSSRQYQDFLALTPNTHYSLGFGIQASNGSALIGEGVTLEVTTAEPTEPSGVGVGLIVGIAVAVLAIVAIVIVVFAVLVRRGVLSPPREQARRIRNTVRRRVQTIYGGLNEEGGASGSKSNYTYDNRQSELYIYGGMDMSTAHVWDIERDDVTFETLIKSGHFANIYKARLRKPNGSSEAVVAKTLKESDAKKDEETEICMAKPVRVNARGHVRPRMYNVFPDAFPSKRCKVDRTVVTDDSVVDSTTTMDDDSLEQEKENYSSDDEFLMKAKINFTGQQVGNHPNILQFVGAVTSNDAMGPFIIYEYCEHGTLKDYLVDNKNNLTIELQENLFRFGLDIAKGMEYLAGKGIVHRRLAARNILLTFVNEVKISGFGPQPQNEEDGDAEKGKKERIPIKWMAPECMESTKGATEKSDVWSYAVVLWEIFSMGETPYTGKGRDIPQRLKKGERLAKPEQCDEVWYNVMRKCWEYKPEKRPTFTKVRDELDNLFVAAPGDDYYYYKR